MFYGIFSASVLWSRKVRSNDGPLFGGSHNPARFSWRKAVWHLRAPVLRALFQQLSDPGRLQPLGLVEVLDWTAAALDRVDRAEFFSRSNEGEAVPSFLFVVAPGKRSKCPDRPRIARDDFVRRQQRDPFDLGLRDQDPVERIHVDGRKQIHSRGVGACHGQFHIPVLQQPSVQQSWVDAELLSP